MENGGLDPVVESWEIMVGLFISEFPRGVGEIGGDPKRRFLGAFALRDRGRKLYPGPGGRAGTSEAEADPKSSGWSMDEYLIRPLNYNKLLNLIILWREFIYYFQGDE